MNYQNYLGQARDRLLALGFTELPAPPDMAAQFGLVLQRTEPWGQLMLALPAAPCGPDGAPREALARAAGAWVRNLGRREEKPRWLVLVFPFERKVPEETARAVRALRQEDASQRWGVVPWTLDLEVELIDRPVGFPRVDDRVSRALTEVPRGAVEGFVRAAAGPRIGAPRRLAIDLGYVPATRLILAATIAYYLWVLLISGAGVDILGGPSLSALIRWGANDGRLVLLGGQHWRLVTHLLLHGGLLHLGLNMWVLWSLGQHVELVYGSPRMTYIYLFAGVSGGVASTVFRAVSVPSVGASGAIMGLFGALLYFGLAMPGRRMDWRSLLVPIGINLFYGFFFAGIDNYAHIGGFLGGLLAGFLVGIPGERRPWRMAATILGAVVVGVVVSGLVPLPHLGLF